jgi:mRNA-degrading endonuclease RelE of RelBE toxin-antitoxin system
MSLGGDWNIEILPTARRELLALRKPIQDRVRDAIRKLADNPLPANSIAMR